MKWVRLRRRRRRAARAQIHVLIKGGLVRDMDRVRDSMDSMLAHTLPDMVCDAFLKGKCTLGARCVAKHMQWEDVYAHGICPLYVISCRCGTAAEGDGGCRYGLKHTRVVVPYVGSDSSSLSE